MRKAKYQKQLTIALPPDHFEKIKQICDEQDISIAEWVRDAVVVALNNIKRKEDQIHD